MLHSTPCFYFVVFFFRLICQTIVRHSGVLWPMIFNVFPLTVSSLLHTSNVWQSFEKKQTKHFYCIQNTNLCYFLFCHALFSDTFLALIWHFIVSFIMSWLLLMCLFFFYSLFILLFSDINPHLNTYDNAVYKIFPDVYVIVAYFACAALLFGNLKPIKRNISFEWI